MSVMNSSSHASQLRVKPTILTKALVKKPVATANREKAVNLSEATSGRLADLPDAKMSAHKEDKSAVNKAGTYENWLYGILGDASDSTPVDNYPSWSSNEHASRK